MQKLTVAFLCAISLFSLLVTDQDKHLSLFMSFCYAEEDVDWNKVEERLFFNLKEQGNYTDAEVFQAIGLTHFQQQIWDRAEAYLMQAVDMDPNLYQSWYHLGLLYMDTEEGYKYFENATLAKPDFPIPYYWMAYYRCRIREDEKAIPLFEQYLEAAKSHSSEGTRIKTATEVLQDLKEGREGKNLSMMRRIN
jgi:tetratricopeptide (TPR) repeat protein